MSNCPARVKPVEFVGMTEAQNRTCPHGFVHIDDTRMKFYPGMLANKEKRFVRGEDACQCWGAMDPVLILSDSDWRQPTQEEIFLCVEALHDFYPDNRICVELTVPAFLLSNNPNLGDSSSFARKSGREDDEDGAVDDGLYVDELT